jgi:hypothetical protein
MKFSRIALHTNNSVVVICEVEDWIVLKRRLPSELWAILAALAPRHDELRGSDRPATGTGWWMTEAERGGGRRSVSDADAAPGPLPER